MKKGRFTSLLHHINVDLLRLAFFELKRNAAPRVDGLTWQDYEARPRGSGSWICMHESDGERIGHCHRDDGTYRKRMAASARSLSLRSKTRYSPTGVNAGSNVPKCAEVKILSWAVLR